MSRIHDIFGHDVYIEFEDHLDADDELHVEVYTEGYDGSVHRTLYMRRLRVEQLRDHLNKVLDQPQETKEPKEVAP